MRRGIQTEKDLIFNVQRKLEQNCEKWGRLALKETNETSLFYTSSKNEKVECKVTNHLKTRMRERFEILTGINLDSEQLDLAIVNLFNNSKRIGNGKNTQYKNRNKKHGGDSLYFQNVHLVFIVQNREIVTVEIVTERELNKEGVMR